MGTYVPNMDAVEIEKDGFGSKTIIGAGDLRPSGEHGEGVIDEREKGLARALKQRHIQMIALAGAIVSIPSPNLLIT